MLLPIYYYYIWILNKKINNENVKNIFSYLNKKIRYFLGKFSRDRIDYPLNTPVKFYFTTIGCEKYPTDIKDIDYDSVFSFKKILYKGNIIMDQLFVQLFNKKIKIDSRFVDELFKRFPNLKEKHIKRFWSNFKAHFNYDFKFYEKYKDSLGKEVGLLKVIGLTYGDLLRRKKVFDSPEGIGQLMKIIHIKKTILGFSDYFIHYINDEFYYPRDCVEFFENFGTDFDYIKQLIKNNNGWKNVFKFFLEKVIHQRDIIFFYTVDYGIENPTKSVIEKHESIIVDRLKDIIT